MLNILDRIPVARVNLELEIVQNTATLHFDSDKSVFMELVGEVDLN